MAEINYSTDDDFLSNDLCLDKLAAKKFVQKPQNNYYEIFLYHSNRLTHKSSEYISSEKYRTKNYITKSGKTIPLKDSLPVTIAENPSGTHDAWLWIIKFICKASCSYNKVNGASLRTYLNCCLQDRRTRNQWEIYIYGDRRYIPVCLQVLSEQHQEIFKLFRINIPNGYDIAKNKIQKKLELNDPDFDRKFSEIKKTLFENGKIDLLYNKKYVEWKNGQDDEGKDKDTTNENRKRKEKNRDKANECFDIISEVIDELAIIERDILRLKFSEGFKIREIMKFFHSNNRIEELFNNKVKTRKQLYKFVDSIVNKVVCDVSKRLKEEIKDKNTAIAEFYELLERRIK